MVDENSLDIFPVEYRIKILREALFLEYPFTYEDIIDFESRIDFEILSMNHYVNWDIAILKRFKHKWDWEAVQKNPFITAYYNLALLFPERTNIKPSLCKCELQLKCCNKTRLCYTEYNVELAKIKNRNPLHRRYYHWIRFRINRKMINPENINTYLFYDIEIYDINNVLKADLEERFLKLEELTSEDYFGCSEPNTGDDEIPF